MKLTEDDKQYMIAWLRNYIDDHCIIRRPTNDDNFVLKSTVAGKNYNWQFYLRRGLFNSKFLSYAGCLFWDKYYEMYKHRPFQIAGMETGSTPLIVGIAMSASLYDLSVNAFSIRKDRKKYGLLNRMEGIPNTDPVFLVDDLCNSKNNLMLAKQYCEEEGLRLYDHAFTIVNKNVYDSDPVDHDKFLGDTIKVESLFKTTDFHLTFEEYNKVQSLMLGDSNEQNNMQN